MLTCGVRKSTPRCVDASYVFGLFPAILSAHISHNTTAHHVASCKG